MKKIILFAVLLPVAMQSEVKAAAAPGLLTRANQALTKVNNYCFNDATEILSTGLYLAQLIYKSKTTGDTGIALQARIPRTHTFLTDYQGTHTMSYYLTIFEFVKTILTFNDKNRNSIKATAGLFKLVTLLGTRVAPNVTEKLVKTKTPILWRSW